MPHSCDTCGYGRRSGTLMTGARCPVIGCHGRIADDGQDDIAAAACEYSGHEWGDAGGGLLICLRCEAERWDEADVA